MIWLILCVVAVGGAEEGPETYKDQFCTDPRTMKKHAAYTEWADAYSCTRHRCQPGGRNLAIYTVGCKRVEAPESAIECEEVVEDTNMQFPYCCTRLRCLVVVRGEVWTRVLGQPWETLPAAPWSHMYKMKKPPPGNEFLPKTGNEGPVYELTDSDTEKTRDKVLRATAPKAATDPNYNEVVPRSAAGGPEAVTDRQKTREKYLRASAPKPPPDASFNDLVPRDPPTPDIVIALTTNDQKEHGKDFIKPEKVESRKHDKALLSYYEEDAQETREAEPEETSTDKAIEASEETKDRREYYSYSYGPTQKPKGQHHRASWTELPPTSWNEHDPALEIETAPKQPQPSYQDFHQQEPAGAEPEKKPGKSSHLQALVDAIGTRMRDIESVVQKMSEKVHVVKPEDAEASSERGVTHDSENQHGQYSQERKTKKPSADGDYKRFIPKNHGGSKYLHGALDGTTEAPVFMDDANANGYFSDASNSMVRRANPRIEPKVPAHEPEPHAPMYMAPVDNRRKAHPSPTSMSEEKVSKKRRKHKKKKKNAKLHKKHHKDGEKKHRNRPHSGENDRIVISLEDSAAN